MPYPPDLLNHDLHRCSESDAVFIEHHLSGLESKVEIYDSKYTEAAKALAEKSPANPIGEGIPGETRKIHGAALTWDGQAWQGSGKNFKLEIGPECDEADVLEWLEHFKTIRERVLIRSFEHIPFHKFLIGKKANEIHSKCVAFATSFGENPIIGCPITDRGHIIAVKTAQASQNHADYPDLLPVNLNTIILHEIGHTLRRQFPELRENLVIEMITNGAMAWHQMENLMHTISPHYLAEQQKSVLMKMGVVHVQRGVEPNHPENKKNAKWVAKVAGEIFAETCRYFYLDAVLEGKSRPPIQTGCDSIDTVIQTMCDQATLTLAKSKTVIPCDGLECGLGWDGPDLV